MNLLIYKTKSELLKDLAEYVITIGEKAIAENDCFNFVLTGGNSPKDLYSMLATEYREKLDWTKVFFFFGDERNVPPGHTDYNGLMAKKSIIDPLNVASDHVFFVDTTLAPADAASAYAKIITDHFKGAELSFDLILLGMGDEGHTASLFPYTTALANKEVNVVANYVEKLAADRITFTAPLINKAKNVAFLVFGEGKADAIKHVVEDDPKNPDLYPSQLINPVDGGLTFFLDSEAAKLLNS